MLCYCWSHHVRPKDHLALCVGLRAIFTMKQERLNGLSLLNVHNSTDYMPSTAEVRNVFLKKNHRLMETKFL